MTVCGKGHDSWSTWTSTDGTIHKYCKSCRRVRARNYSTRKKSAKGDHTRSEWEAKKRSYDRCPQCGRKWEDVTPSKGSAKYKITKDHIIPLIEGGTDYISNIQPLCYQCNFGKGRSLKN